MKAAFLIRCSTKKQDYDRQVKDLQRLSEKLGYETAAIFGEHITGKDDASQKDRLSIRHLKQAAMNREFDVVLVSEVSRMSRDPMSGRLYVRQLINMNVPVYFRDINVWTIDPNTGKKINDAETVIGGAFDAAWKYIKSMKTQIASGRRDELDNNQMSIGQPFFGYKRYGGTDKTKKNSWVIDEEKAEIVRAVFAEYNKDGSTLKSTALAITAKYGIKRFSVSTIEHILRFEPYHTGIKVVSLKDPDTEEVDKFNVAIPTIITKAVFDKATAKREQNRATKAIYPKQTIYLLSKLIKCPICGHTLTPRKKSDGHRYRLSANGNIVLSWTCMGGINNQTECNSRIAINNDKIEAIIWGLVKSELISYANLNTEERLLKIEELNNKIDGLNVDIKNYEAEIANNDRLIERAYNAYMEAPDIVMEAAKQKYLQTLTKCQNEKDSCVNKIEGLKRDIERFTEYRKAFIQPTIPQDAIEKAEADPLEKRRLVTELIDKIYPYKIETYISPATNKVIKNGILLLEVYSIGGLYYILFDGNQRNNKVAYYMGGNYATFQNGKNKFDAYNTGEYFVISNASMVMDTEEVDEVVSVNEFVEVAKLNNLILEY